MKKWSIIFALMTMLVGCNSETGQEPDVNPCNDWEIQVQIGQIVKFVNQDGFWSEDIDYERMKLFATDANWNILVNNQGEPLQEISNGIEAKKVFDQNGTLSYVHLCLGQIKQQKDIDAKKSYFLLKVNDNTFHQIVAEYYTDCGDCILTKFKYNGTEYMANDKTVINIAIE